MLRGMRNACVKQDMCSENDIYVKKRVKKMTVECAQELGMLADPER